MDDYIFEGKNILECLTNAHSSSKFEKNTAFFELIDENSEKNNQKVSIKVITGNDELIFLRNVVKNIVDLMNIDSTVEILKEKQNVNVVVNSSNNSILIGKNGKIIQSLQYLVRNIYYQNYSKKYNIFIEIGDYKEKQKKNIERVALKVADEVIKTKVSAKLESMNSYKRRIIHKILSNNNNIVTESIGEEPNRYVLIKFKEK